MFDYDIKLQRTMCLPAAAHVPGDKSKAAPEAYKHHQQAHAASNLPHSASNAEQNNSVCKFTFAQNFCTFVDIFTTE